MGKTRGLSIWMASFSLLASPIFKKDIPLCAQFKPEASLHDWLTKTLDVYSYWWMNCTGRMGQATQTPNDKLHGKAIAAVTVTAITFTGRCEAAEPGYFSTVHLSEAWQN